MIQSKKMKLKRNLSENFANPVNPVLHLLIQKIFQGETKDMNSHLFQTIDESKDTTQYVKTVEALEHYAFKTYSVDLSSLFCRENPKLPTIELPVKPTEEEIDETPAKEDIYLLKLKEYIKEEKALKVALKSMWAVIWGQCSNSIRTKLEKKKYRNTQKPRRRRKFTCLHTACLHELRG